MMKVLKHKNILIPSLVLGVALLAIIGSSPSVYAAFTTSTDGGTSASPTSTPSSTSTTQSQTGSQNSTVNLGETNTNHQCGSGDGAVKTSINFGCKGESCLSSKPDTTYCSGNNSGILDVTFAIIRFLSYGVGLIVVASIIFAGIQYTSSQGDPKATAAAQTRIKATVIALLVYIFGYAILNYVIPAGFIK